MRKKLAFDILLFVSLFFLSACQSEISREEPDGNVHFVLLDIDRQVISRAVPSELENPLTGDFSLKVTDQRNGNTVYDGAYLEQMVLRPGLYNILAYYGDDTVLALDKPCYAGLVPDVEVKSKENTGVNIPCTVSNALLSVAYSNPESFSQVYSDYYITVHAGSQQIDIKDTSKSAYFKAGSLVGVVFHGIRADNGAPVEMALKQTGELPRVMNAAQHLKLTLSVDPSDIELNVNITKTEVNKVTISETFPAEWLPKPKLEAVDFINNELTFAETERVSAKLNFNTVSPVQDIKVMLSFEDPAMKAHNGEYLLSNPDDAQKLESLKINIPADKSSIDFVNLTSQLQTNAGATTTNLVTVDVKANNRWSSEDKVTNRTYMLKCTKPEFNVSVYPGNIWTREFTVNPLQQENVIQGKGNFVRLSQDMAYQFSTNQKDWLNLDATMTPKGLTPGTKYYVRGLYRGCVEGTISEVVTYAPISLTNGGLEGARVVNGNDSPGIFGTNYGAIYELEGWATTNHMTADYCPRTAYSYNSRSGVRPTDNSHSGKALRVITMSYGYGGTDASPSKFTHSELYLGSNADENGARNYGIAWNSHPTALKFWFRCISNVGNDQSKVKIEVCSGTEVLGQGSFLTGATGNSYSECIVKIDYDRSAQKLMLKPDKLVIVFSSGTKANLSKSDLVQFGYGIANKQKDVMWRGNELFVDDVELLYEK